jgi:hypothetical protein
VLGHPKIGASTEYGKGNLKYFPGGHSVNRTSDLMVNICFPPNLNPAAARLVALLFRKIFSPPLNSMYEAYSPMAPPIGWMWFWKVVFEKYKRLAPISTPANLSDVTETSEPPIAEALAQAFAVTGSPELSRRESMTFNVALKPVPP